MGRLALRIAGNLAVLALSGGALLLAVAFGPTLFGYESLIVAGGSMGKALPVGSVALTRMVDVKAIAVGDIVSFRHAGAKAPTTHRVIKVERDGTQRVFTTKGDANASPDPEPLGVEGRIHLVEHVVPFAGYAVRFARTPAGALLLFLVPIAGLTLDRRGRSAPPGSTPDPSLASPQRGPRNPPTSHMEHSADANVA